MSRYITIKTPVTTPVIWFDYVEQHTTNANGTALYPVAVTPTRTEYQGWHTRFCIVDGKLCMSTKGAELMGMRQMWVNPDYMLGRERWYIITDAILDEAVGYATYPRRSEREEAVAARITKLVEWVMDTQASL